MRKISDRLTKEKPWAVMGLSRAEYMKAKPWKTAKGRMSRSEFEDLIRELGHAFFKELETNAQAEGLVAAIFGKDSILPR